MYTKLIVYNSSLTAVRTDLTEFTDLSEWYIFFQPPATTEGEKKTKLRCPYLKENTLEISESYRGNPMKFLLIIIRKRAPTKP